MTERGVGLSEPADLTEREFARFQRLIHAEGGIFLAEGKRALLVARLSRRVRQLGLESFGAYCALTEADPAELVRMLDLVSTNETHFFREPRQFDLLERLCDGWIGEADAGQRPRHVRVWSAACSTGEEPYSIGMVLHERLAPHGWGIEILASDLSTRVLQRARAGVYSIEKAHEIPEPYLHRYMERGVGPETGRARACGRIRALVRFERINLARPSYPVTGTFDAVFCRNVLIYFDTQLRTHVVGQLLARLTTRGHLFLGHAESLMGRAGALRSVMPAVYRRAEPAVASSAA